MTYKIYITNTVENKILNEVHNYNRYVIVLIFQVKLVLSKCVVMHDVCHKLRTQDHMKINIYYYT